MELKYFNQHFLIEANKKDGLNSNGYKEALAGLMKGSRNDGIDRVMNDGHLEVLSKFGMIASLEI